MRTHFARPQWLDLSMIFVLLLFATGLSYMWFWVVPYWLFFAMGAFVVLALPPRLAAINAILLRARWSIILPWIGFIAVIAARDATTGALTSSFTDRVGLNLATLTLFLACAVLSFRCDWRHVLMVIGILGSFFGLIALGQFSGSDALWRLPDTLSAYSSRDVSFESSIAASISADDIAAGFSRVGRARGLDVFVHKFSAYQGILAGLLVGVTLLSWQVSQRHRSMIWWFTLCALVTTLGMALTFSRAPIFGLACAQVAVLWVARRQSNTAVLIMLSLFSGALVIGALAIGLIEADQFARLFEVGTNTANDATRMDTWVYSLQLFLGNPLVGAGTNMATGATDLSTHSVPLRILGDFGLLGFTFYAWVWGALAREAWRASKTRNAEGPIIGAVVISALIVAAIDNLTHSSGLLQRDISQPALMGLCYGLAASAQRYGMLPPHDMRRPVAISHASTRGDMGTGA